MASSLLFSLSLLLLLLLPIAAYAKLGGAPVGGRTEIPNVARNKEVQSLGRFSVAEHNKSVRLGIPNGGGALLSFVRVVEAQSQVVAGIKYYLKIAAADGEGKVGKFDAEVVVRRWANSKTLISFTPSEPGQ